MKFSRILTVLVALIFTFITSVSEAKKDKPPKEPKELVELASIDFADDQFIQDVAILGKTAYVSLGTTDDFGDGSFPCPGVYIYDLEDAENPVQTGTIPCLDLSELVPGPAGNVFIPPASISVMKIKTEEFSGTVLAQGLDSEWMTNLTSWLFSPDFSFGALAPSGLALWDVSDPAAPVSLGTALRTGAVIGDVDNLTLFNQGKEVFVATQLVTPGNFATGPLPGGPEGFYVIDITAGLGGPPTSWDPVGSFTIAPFPYPVGSFLHWQFNNSATVDIVVDKKGKVASVGCIHPV